MHGKKVHDKCQNCWFCTSTESGDVIAGGGNKGAIVASGQSDQWSEWSVVEWSVVRVVSGRWSRVGLEWVKWSVRVVNEAS